ncbi:MAG: hypothetical protein ABJD53_07395 [Gammaproteobacteria bacterium]
MDRSDGPLAEDPNARHSAFTSAVCLDLPYILDSVWRHAEYDANSLFSYRIAQHTAGNLTVSLTRRPYTASPAFWFFLLTLVFVAYGATFDAWCSVVGAAGMRVTRLVLGVLTMCGAASGWWVLRRYGKERAEKRFKKAKPPVLETEVWRRRFVHFGVQAAILCLVGGVLLFGWFLLRPQYREVCHAVPSPVPAQLQLLVLVGVAALCYLLGRRSMNARWRIAWHAILLLGMAVLLWGVIAESWASEANQSPYLHVYGVFACVLALLAVAAPAIAHWQLGSVTQKQRDMYRLALCGTELFPASRDDPGISTRRICAALSTGVSYHLLHFLLLPAFFALMVPSRYVLGAFICGGAISAWLLMAGNFTPRWQAMVDQVRRWYLVGTPLAVSVGVIVLAVLRLFRVQYVATVLDAAPFGVIFTWIVMAYALLWWFEYAVNACIASELLSIFAAQPDDRSDQVPYPATAISPQARTVEANDRFIVAHGAGRFAALGWFMEKSPNLQQPTLAFQTFDLMELFARLTPAGLGDFWQDLKRRIQLYFLTLNALIVLILGCGFGYYGYADRHNTVDSIVRAEAPGGDAHLSNLAALLLQHGSNTPAYIVAASGGGTRAAVYAATVLEGLQKLQVGRQIVLLSGVSGGGVALAYLYAHRDALLTPGAASEAEWGQFKRLMAEPFIGDVLEGAGEWRVMSREPLGRLLVESFARRLFAVGPRQATIGDSDQLALILNTTITAHPQEDSDLLRGAFSGSEDAAATCDSRHIPYALMGGGRLIFTNLLDRQAFPSSGAPGSPSRGIHIPDVRLPYVVVQDPHVSLAAASTLNANFPPVFTSARVDVPSEGADPMCPDRTYYVTDGGANENLGLVSALYALRAALNELVPGEIPPIHIVIIEASETSYDYTPDRGIDAAIGGAKERLTGALTQELLNEIQHRIAEAAGDEHRIQIHYLALPLTFRSRGGFGTHWMFPDSVLISDPRQARPLAAYKLLIPHILSSAAENAVLDQAHIVALWTALHDPKPDFCAREWQQDSRRVAAWICGADGTDTGTPPADLHIVEWQRLVAAVNKEKREMK